MLERLSSLTLGGFRGYLERVEVPLGGDVVLIFGDNGAGKSSLMAAIEYALTGEVQELAGLEDDYPRCLTHVDSDTPAHVALSARGKNGEELEFGTGSADSTHLAHRDARHFVQRCYLSQHRLTRLLDVYRQDDAEASEETLVAFVRELLGLGRLDALTEGLHEAGDIRRLRNAVVDLQRLQSELGESEAGVQSAKANFERGKARLESSLDQLGGALEAAEIPPATDSGLSSLNSLVARLEEVITERAGSPKAKTVSKWESELARMNAVLPDEVQGPSVDELTSRIERQEERLRKLNALLIPVVQEGSELQLQQAPSLQEDPAADLVVLSDAARSELSRLEKETAAAQKVAEERRMLEERLERVEDELGGLEEDLPSRSSRINRLASLLAEARGLIEGERCPVCSRDFSEVQEGPLKDHVSRHLEELTAESARLQELVSRRAELLEERHGLSVRREGMVFGGEELIEASMGRRNRVARFLRATEAVRTTLEDCAEASSELTSLKEQLRLARSRDSVWHVVAGNLAEAFQELELEGGVPSGVPALLHRVEEAVAARRRELDEGERRLEAALSSAARARDLATELAAETKRLKELEAASATLRQGLRRVQDLATAGRGVRDAASRAKRRLIEEAFTENLNSLWADLFQRLTNERIFSPSLETEILPRGRLRAEMRAMHGEERPFDHLRAVLSAGNVNTAALSLFLSLHLVHEPNSRVLVLDDPVQSMDDLHAVEFASLLELIVKQADRQLILAVHERPLFEYLADQLAPSSPDGTMVLVEVTRVGRTSEASATVVTGPGERSALPPTG